VSSVAVGARRPRARTVRTEVGTALLPLPLARGIAVLALAMFGVLHWMQLLDPPAAFRGWEAIGIGVLAVGGLLVAARAPEPWQRRSAAAAIGVAAFALALLAAGVADEDLKPGRWDVVAGGVGRGLETLPGARVPFRGLDEWTRTVIAAGGTLLVVLGALLAFWPRSGGRLGYRVPALIVLVTLYAVPSIALIFEREFLAGAFLVVLVLAFLRLERLRSREAPAAGLAVLATALLGLLAAPALDRDEPWWDYESWALQSSTSKTTAFSWDHDYRPLDWPRDGRELLRVKADRPAYWKAQNLDFFDGGAWQESSSSFAPQRQYPGVPLAPAPEQADRRWLERIEVSVRNLRSSEVVTAGAPLRWDVRPRGAEFRAPGNLVASGRSLRRGDVYSADVYYPEPPAQQLRVAGTNYDPWLDEHRILRLPQPTGLRGGGSLVSFPAQGEAGGPQVVRGPGEATGAQADNLVEGSGLSRTWGLAQRLRAQATSPYDYVEEVEDYLTSDAFTYTETPPPSGETLEGFLFDARQGFCQQYSGAMALLLRMGGVPARVSAGFTSGSRDSKTKEWVVRDLDAHSWVEAWFPGHGWVTFDPTPAAAPPRSQRLDDAAPSGASGSGDRPGIGLQGLSQARGGQAAPGAAAAEADGFPWLTVGIGAALLALAGACVGVQVRRRRAGRRRLAPGPAALAELERALRRARRSLAPGTTLSGLERRFGGSPGAAGYLRALREQRYSDPAHPAPGPTREQRSALRGELGRGGGVAGRLRAWWALPPRLRGSASANVDGGRVGRQV